MAAPIFASIAVAILSIIILGFYDVMTNFENNSCEMTYMYEYPEYLNIDLGKTGKKFPSYALYIYGEGYGQQDNPKSTKSYLNKIRNLRLTGIPVLFIPGNAGSYKQVRSLGSVALRLAEHPHVKNSFNYFAVDFNEELSGLYGGVLTKQTDFVVHCLQKIMSLYDKSESLPKSVVLVGHSMGGMVARALFTHPDFDHSLVNTIITQATPHQKPDLQQFYFRVNEYWKTHGSTTLRHVTVVSTGGGSRDMQVRYALTNLDRFLEILNVNFGSFKQNMQFLEVLNVNFGSFKQNMQISSDADLRMKVFRHHFLANNGISGYLSHEDNKTITIDTGAKWEVHTDRLWKFASRKVVAITYFVIPLVVEEDKGSDAVFIMSNMTNQDWVCYCDIPQGQQKCTTCTSLSSHTELLPPLYSNSKYVKVMYGDIAVTNDTHIIIIVPAGERMVNIITDRYNSNLRHLIYQMPNTYDIIISFPISATDGAAMLKISNASTFYSLHLAGLALPLNAYTAVVTPQGCRKHNAENFEGSVLRLHIPWSSEDTYTYSNYGKEASIPIKLQVGRPADYDWRQDASEPHLEMFLHPYCHYHLKLLVATQDSLGQAVRFYGIQFPGYYVAVLLITLRGIIIAQGKGQVTSTRTYGPADALLDHGKPYLLIPIVLVVRFIIRLGPIANLLTKLGVPKDDATSLTEEGIYFTLLPTFMYIGAWFTSYLQAFLAFIFFSAISYLGRLFSWIPENVFGKLSYLQHAVSGLAVLLTLVCGTLGTLCLSSLLICKILRLLYITGLKLDTKENHRQLTLIFPIMLLVNCQILLSMGPFVIWIKRVAYTGSWFQQLSPDPSRIPALVSCACISVLIYGDGIILSRIQGAVSGWLLHVLATVVVLYSMESLYRLPTFISLVSLIITVPTAIGFVSKLMKTERRKDE